MGGGLLELVVEVGFVVLAEGVQVGPDEPLYCLLLVVVHEGTALRVRVLLHLLCLRLEVELFKSGVDHLLHCPFRCFCCP